MDLLAVPQNSNGLNVSGILAAFFCYARLLLTVFVFFNLCFSAYCGGLWLAALRTMSEIAKILGYPEDIRKYSNILQRGRRAYERKLWNGKGA